METFISLIISTIIYQNESTLLTRKSIIRSLNQNYYAEIGK